MNPAKQKTSVQGQERNGQMVVDSVEERHASQVKQAGLNSPREQGLRELASRVQKSMRNQF